MRIGLPLDGHRERAVEAHGMESEPTLAGADEVIHGVSIILVAELDLARFRIPAHEFAGNQAFGRSRGMGQPEGDPSSDSFDLGKANFDVDLILMLGEGFVEPPLGVLPMASGEEILYGPEALFEVLFPMNLGPPDSGEKGPDDHQASYFTHESTLPREVKILPATGGPVKNNGWRSPRIFGPRLRLRLRERRGEPPGRGCRPTGFVSLA